MIKIERYKLSKSEQAELLDGLKKLQDIAKAVWGDDVYIPEDFGMDILSWEWHLSKIVTAKDVGKELDLHIKDL